MNFEHSDLEKFEPFLRQVLDLAFTSGVNALNSKGYQLQDIGIDTTARDVFIRGCHYGYDKAQQRIGAKILTLDSQIRQERERLKDLRRQRDKGVKTVTTLLRILGDRQLVLRRIIDTIVYTIVAPDDWVMRRLGDNEIRSIDPVVLARTLEYANSKNQESRRRFAVVSDLTTFVHMGDLFEVSWVPGERKSWQIIELKEGRVNSLLSGILREKSGELAEDDIEKIKQMLGADGVKQARRMQRQNESRRQFHRLIATDRGIDFASKMEMFLTSDMIVTEDYEEDVSELVGEAETRGYASKSIDGCLHLVAFRGEILPIKKHTLVPLFHLSSHIARHRELPPQTDLFEQWKDFDSNAPIVDVVDLSMRVPCAKAIFSWASVSLTQQIDLAFGRIRVVAYFDIDAFVDQVKSRGIKCAWITGTDADSIRKISPIIPGSPDAHGLRMEFPSGVQHIIMNGFFSRVHLYLTKPSCLISMIMKLEKENQELKRRLSIEPKEV